MSDLWRSHGLFLALIAGHALAGLGMDQLAGTQIVRIQAWTIQTAATTVLLAFIWVPVLFLSHLVKARARNPRHSSSMARAVRGFFGDVLTSHRTGSVFVAWLGVVAAITLHDGWKGSIRHLNPYAWDLTLSRWDWLVHGGRHAWEVLQPLLGVTWIVRALDFAYVAWYPVVGLGIGWFVWSDRRELRAQFLVALALVLIVLGTTAAQLFSSGGPCFFHGLTGQDSYAPLFEQLKVVDGVYGLASLRLQSTIWHAYMRNDTAYWISISAMPSLHVGLVALIAIAAFREVKAVGVLLGVYAFVILVASVALGWHYAIDGYVSLAGVWILWRFAGALLQRWDGRMSLSSRDDS